MLSDKPDFRLASVEKGNSEGPVVSAVAVQQDVPGFLGIYLGILGTWSPQICDTVKTLLQKNSTSKETLVVQHKVLVALVSRLTSTALYAFLNTFPGFLIVLF